MRAAAGKPGEAAPCAAAARRRPAGCRCCAPPRRASVPTHHQKSSTVSKVYTARSVWPQVACFCLPLGLSNQSVHLVSSGCFWEKSGSPAGGGGGADEAPGHAGQAGGVGGRPGARAAADGLVHACRPRRRAPAAPPCSSLTLLLRLLRGGLLPSHGCCCYCCCGAGVVAWGLGRRRSREPSSNRAMHAAIGGPGRGCRPACCAPAQCALPASPLPSALPTRTRQRYMRCGPGGRAAKRPVGAQGGADGRAADGARWALRRKDQGIKRKPRGSRAAHKMQRAKQVETVCQLHSKDSSFKEAAAAARRGGRRGEGSRRHAARLGCGAGGGHAGAGSAVLPARMAARSRDDCALAHQALCCPLAAYADGCAATGAWLGLGLHGVLILSHLSA